MAVLTVLDINNNPKWQAAHPDEMLEHAETLLEAEANAYLMAAAPKMFAALKYVLENHREVTREFEDVVLAALASTRPEPITKTKVEDATEMKTEDDLTDDVKRYYLCEGCLVEVYAGGSGQFIGSLDPDNASPEFADEISALERLVTAHACAGVNVSDPKYIAGLETVLQAL